MNLATGFLFAWSLRSSLSTPILEVSTDQWRELNASVDGRLHIARPFALPCFSLYKNRSVPEDIEACSAIQANYTSPNFRLESFSANMNVEYETCMSTHSQCLLDTTDPTSPLATTGISCEQGEIPPYYIDISTASDVQEAFKFSKQTQVPLSIKNTGHDYMGRSRRQNSLGLWTHNLQAMSFHPQFVPEQCGDLESQRAITVGAGVTFEQVYAFADDNDAMFVGAYAQSVGVSGGWVMGGGHSVLSPTLGLGVDRVLEIKLVTPDGKLRSANECQNADLFWALRGGGGGTFGVVLESTHRVERRIPLQVINMTFTPTSSNLREYFEILVNTSAEWAALGWGGHVNSAPAGIIYVNPRLSLAQATASMAQLSAFAKANDGTAVIETLPSWYDFFMKFIVEVEAPVGNLLALGSRLIPKANFESGEGRASLVAHLLAQTAARGMPYIPVGTPISFNYTPGTTSVTPAWRDAIWHLASGSSWPYNSTAAQTRGVLGSLHDFVHRNLTALAPNSGAYMNEGDVYESDHEFSYWGPNYPRLLALKQKYDPEGLLDCWRCVGWKGAAEFPCYPKLDT
ncbi:FAD-binding domain-containing protein [Mycena maculata]|uniref:FAD-binding domain-containing protein n=1 Tax=Mycena maculata TaxID=230809 RepID=A0AAD7JX43_9AGAR|nr:FAD-binding domain-containing protein [Mycena maculata]